MNKSVMGVHGDECMGLICVHEVCTQCCVLVYRSIMCMHKCDVYIV